MADLREVQAGCVGALHDEAGVNKAERSELEKRLKAIEELCEKALRSPARAQEFYCAAIRRIDEIARGKA